MLFKFQQFAKSGSKVIDYLWLIISNWHFSSLNVFTGEISQILKGRKQNNTKWEQRCRKKWKNLHLGGKTKMFIRSPLCLLQSSPALGVRPTGWILCKAAPSSNVTLTFNLSLHFSTTLCAQNWRTSCHYNGPRPACLGQWQITSSQATEINCATTFCCRFFAEKLYPFSRRNR